MYPIEPYQQLFPFQGGGSNSGFNPNRYYQIEIIEGTDYAYMEKTAYQDSSGEYHPREYLGQYLTGVKGDELSGTGQYVIYGFLSSGTYVRENGTNYFIHFDNYNQTEVNVTVKITDLDSNITTYWYTTVVNPQLEIVDQQLSDDTLLHYYSKDVSLKLNNTKYPCTHPGYGGCPPDEVTFNIEITEGEQYGSIKNSETGEISTTFTGLSCWNETRSTIFTYYANGVQPDSTDWVTIRHSSSDAEMQAREIRFLVKRNSIPPPSEGGSIYIQVDKHYAMPSDTINIHLLWINEVNDTIEFLPMQNFRVEIAEGLDYGRLVDLESGMQGDELNDASSNLQLIIETEIPVDIAKIILVAQADVLRFNRAVRGTNEIQQEEAVEINKNNKKEPVTPELIIVGEHIVGIAEVTVDKNPLVVEIIPEEISAGDTARIVPKKKNSDGSLSEFPADQQFEIGMLDGCMLGKLSNAAIDTNYFYGVTQPIYFIADSSADSGIVELRLGIIDNTTGNKSTKGRITTEEGEYCFLSAFQSEKYKDVEVKVEKVYEILLGETKYYQARFVDGKLVIDELSGPNLWNGGLGEDVWGNNPVNIVEGDKLGVYWETEKPVWDGIIKGENLSKGLIRLVGRHCDVKNNIPYKVKLTAQKGTDKAEIEIMVIKPSKLGNKYDTSIDVFSQTVKIDEICIEWGNELGIPPHFIKGQMKSETSFYHPFYPTYVYEPYTTQFDVMKMYSNNEYFIEENTATFEPALPIHSNIKDYPYPSNPTTVWQIIEDYSDLVNLVTLRKYGSRRATENSSKQDGILYFYGTYSYPQKKYNEYKKEAYKKYDVKIHPENEPQANNDARNSLVNHLKNEWDGGIKDGKKGLVNIKAQTRIAASYGLLQILYTTARYNFGYPKNLLPEELIEPNNMQYSKKKVLYHLNKLKTKENGNENNWNLGLEGSIRDYIWHQWNPNYKKYPDKVHENVLLYKEIK
jgi:hypothetical protein